MPVRKLTDAQVVNARELYATGEYTQVMIAEVLNVSPPAVWSMLHGRTHRRAGGPVALPPRAAVSRLEVAAMFKRIRELEAQNEDLAFRIEELTGLPAELPGGDDLPHAERQIMGALLRHPGQTIPYGSLMAAYGGESLTSLKVLVSRVRRRFPEYRIETVRAVGFKYNPAKRKRKCPSSM